MQSWQIFHCASKVLPPGTLQGIYSRHSKRTLYYWSADPASSTSRRNPIDRLQILFRKLETFGYGHVVRAAIDLLAATINYRCVPIETAKSDRGTLDGELTDSLQALSNFAEKARAAKADGVIDVDEREQIIEALRMMEQQLAEALDTLGLVPEGEKEV